MGNMHVPGQSCLQGTVGLHPHNDGFTSKGESLSVGASATCPKPTAQGGGHCLLGGGSGLWL